MEILYKKEKEEADQLLEQQRLVRLILYALRVAPRKIKIVRGIKSNFNLLI